MFSLCRGLAGPRRYLDPCRLKPSGIGAATARRLAADGAAVVIGDVNVDGAEQVAAGILHDGGTASVRFADVSEESMVAELVGTTVERHGRLDILHNNAALLDIAFLNNDTDVVTVSLETWDKTLAVNVRGYVVACGHCCAVCPLCQLDRRAHLAHSPRKMSSHSRSTRLPSEATAGRGTSYQSTSSTLPQRSQMKW